MNGMKLFLAEWAKIRSNKGLLFSLLAVLLIPIVYAAIQLSPTWGPYDNLSNLPVAVVNLDRGGKSGDETINVGKDLVADLKKSNTLGWKFVDSVEADKGLKENRYYMVIEIPEDFSERVATVLEPDPKQLELRYIQNEGLNFMAAQVTKSATERIREQLANKITENYAKTIFSNLGDIADGFKSAAEGSGKIYDGSTELKNGTDQILQSLTEKSADINKLATGAKELKAGTGQLLENLTSKQGDISKLAAGSKELKDGTGQLLQSLQAKSADISKLAAGTKELEAGTSLLLKSLQEKSKDISTLAVGAKALETGANDLQDGTGKVLVGLQQSQAGSNQVATALGQLQPGSKQVATGVEEVQKGAAQLAAGSSQLTAGLEAFLKKNPQLQTNKEFLTLVGTSKVVSDGLTGLASKTEPLKEGANLVAGGLEKVAPGSKALSSGLDELVKGQQLVSDGAKQLAGGTKQVAAGTATVDAGWKTITSSVATIHSGTAKIKEGNLSVESGWSTMTAGVSKLNAGTNQIYNGNQAVESGWKALSTGAAKLNSGMGQVSDGNESVMNGWVALTDGVTKVNDGLGQLNNGSKELATGLKDGSEKTSSIHAGDKNIAMFASPVELAGSTVNEYERYRDSTAPYIISLALFVGTIIMSFFVDFKKPIGAPVSAGAWFISKFMSLSLLAISQGVIVTLFTLVFLKLKVESGFLFMLFGILVSISFMMIVWFLIALGGNLGRFISFALLVLQLSITGANLPIEMLPESLRAISPYLPLTYSIEGFKSIISLGDFTMAYGNAGILLGYLAVFLILAFATFIVHFKSKSSQFDLNA
ncbi:YhgE/Pip family protein [Bacillus sp. CGMCC 1.16607]|uniref:YhgE/Pip family protein n=1 Tax=Bacillus sp. CGMCC 1.16607 TaxID=3351842 RepID=UPI003638C676